MKIHVSLQENSYDIETGNGLLTHLPDYIDLNRKVMIVTDAGVPAQYAQTVADRCLEPVIETLAVGEDSKSLQGFTRLEESLLTHDFSRKDLVVAVGGGVVGDLAGFAAACYMRGIDFVNIPTTVLSQVDSSIGGKCAINFCGVKNIVGAFYQPKAVIIDHDVLKTLPRRHVANGLVEAIKMAATFDAALFEEIERAKELSDLYPVIARAIDLKRKVVEEDEKETGLRKVLNFGHTLGHGVEAACMPALLHGECVALGMLPMCAPSVRTRLCDLLRKWDLHTAYDFDTDLAMDAIRHDKKGNSGSVTTVYVEQIGAYEMRESDYDSLKEALLTIQGS
ncbi:MAG: 3-dehydroquinate synthase [Lachnospiraceae bacterium]|nr:3-dehydroquinate synthase [Lachnospiraceae bacterium]